ncbi:dolichyl-diphosphooligosaccharide-protein glycotransferase [Pseudohyphozyma bogoriensis]|nr:dolichyl-diphosphooligosaccharide-protein glycotransferase [Pseudohyphozyma bogoriensis]
MRLPATATGLVLLATQSLALLSVPQGKLSLVSSVGSTSLSSSFSSTSASPAPPTEITSGDTLKLSFTVEKDGDSFQPQQAMISWVAKAEGRDHSSVVKVRKSGSAKWELDFSRAPTSLLSVSTGPIDATLLIGHAGESALQIPLGTFTFAPSLALPFPYPADSTLPAGWEVERFGLMPEIKWTFRGAEKQVKSPIAVLGLLFVLSPWLAFAGIISHLKPSLTTPTLNITLFLASIVSFEALIVAYWTSLKLIPTLPYFLLLAGTIAVTGRRALGDIRKRRLASEAAPKKDL